MLLSLKKGACLLGKLTILLNPRPSPVKPVVLLGDGNRTVDLLSYLCSEKLDL